MPKIEWKHDGCIENRVHLRLSGEETPYFVDVESRGLSRYSLWGAGMGPMNSAGFRIAGEMGRYRKISEAKARAIELCRQPV